MEKVTVLTLWMGGSYVFMSDDIPQLWAKHKNFESAYYIMYQALDKLLVEHFEIKDVKELDNIKIDIIPLEKVSLH